ncbi:hypothetical protein vBAbaPP1_06 [Acinetobacter phage vB_AbaM_P1]|nr:hypothetical protein vBAbaPP1_06 [Acinetobacter phage vB_AbaM_P1]WAX22665.1 hypothetical protein [Acinetobacter phage vB_AbaP_HB01]
MKLNNHVPHKLKKRILKKRVQESRYEASVKYYELLKLVKSINIEAYRYLVQRLRIRGVLNDKENQSFTGFLMRDFTWSSTPQGPAYWARLDSRVLNHMYDNAYHKKHSKV